MSLRVTAATKVESEQVDAKRQDLTRHRVALHLISRITVHIDDAGALCALALVRLGREAAVEVLPCSILDDEVVLCAADACVRLGEGYTRIAWVRTTWGSDHETEEKVGLHIFV